jgi:small-conductance mechanosensitive channel
MQELLAQLRELDTDFKQVLVHALRIAIIVGAAWLAQSLTARLSRLFEDHLRRTVGGEELARVQTLERVLRNSAAAVIALVAGMLVLGELGVSIAPILATAGVAGIAIGFGAQSLVKDYFNGVFLLLDDQIRQGDVVEIAGKGGLVEEVTLRYVRLRDFDGHVHYVPNGEIKVVTNRTRGFAQAVIEVGIAYRDDPDTAFAVMREVAAEMRAEADWGRRMAADIEIIGVENWADAAVIVRARLKVEPPIEQWNVKREFLKRLKKAFDERGIEIPFPQLTVHSGGGWK